MAERPSLPMRLSIPPHRCFYLCLVLVLLIVLLPAFDHSKAGRQWFAFTSLLVLVTSLVAPPVALHCLGCGAFSSFPRSCF